MTEPRHVSPMQKQELFLPVHGHVELFPEEIAVIDHPSFQRLRRVKQLGLAHMVFPGATHTRFEHSIGAVHVAQLIVNHVNSNYLKLEKDHRQWEMIEVDEATTRFIRLAALLHDIGHLPLGHTLEDELNHLRSHDGPERLRRVAEFPFPNYQVDRALVSPSEMPSGGWTLKALVDRLYMKDAAALGLANESAFDILSHIVCKAPKKEGPEKASWEAKASALRASIPLNVCRDIVGDTICADFLDYIHRDWYHLGKPLYVDKRLYQYMEVRQRTDASDGVEEPCFVVNVGASEKVRHDALTDILVLLDARYRLAETVLFHRTKLALTGLLDRCLLEISDLYTQVGLGVEKFKENAEALLLEASDDGLPGVLKKLAAGGDKSGKQRIEDATQKESEEIRKVSASGAQQTLIPDSVQGRIGAQHNLILNLIEKFRDRDVYTLACKLRMADFTGPHKPKNPRLGKLLALYGPPEKRLDYLRKMEALCGLPAGTLVMDCPPDAAMNAKVAKVNLYIEDDVSPFDEYEAGGPPNLTCGALVAQISRFYELWAASVYVDPHLWDALSENERKNLKSVLKEFLFLVDGSKDPHIVRAQMTSSLEALHKMASRSGSVDVRLENYRGTSFPSGLPFDQPAVK